MASDQSHLDLGCIVRSQLIGDDPIRREALLLQQSTHELCGRSLVSSSLHEQVENFALAVDGKARTACRQSQRPSHRDATARSAVGACAEVLGRTRVRTSKPKASRSRRRQPALGEQILYVAKAQGEAKVEPRRMLDDNRRKAVASIRDCCHATILRPGPTRSSVTVTLPVQAPFHGRPHREGSPDKTGHWVLIAIHSGRCQTANPRSSVFVEGERNRASSNSR
jgi:hypothetical protein